MTNVDAREKCEEFVATLVTAARLAVEAADEHSEESVHVMMDQQLAHAATLLMDLVAPF